MNESEVNSLINSIPSIKRFYRGIFTLTRLPHKLLENEFCIVYRETEENNCGHWFSLYRTDKTTVEVFDSLVLPRKHSSSIGRQLKCSIIKNTSKLQSSTSVQCGLFCVYYIYHRFLNIDLLFEHYMNDFFSGCVEENESRIKTFSDNLSRDE